MIEIKEEEYRSQPLVNYSSDMIRVTLTMRKFDWYFLRRIINGLNSLYKEKEKKEEPQPIINSNILKELSSEKIICKSEIIQCPWCKGEGKIDVVVDDIKYKFICGMCHGDKTIINIISKYDSQS
jgi:hypothetical protein